MDYLNSLTVQQLKDIIRYHNLHFNIKFSKLRKNELIEMIHKFYIVAEEVFHLRPEEFSINTPAKKAVKQKIVKEQDGNERLKQIFAQMAKMPHNVKKKRVSKKGKDIKKYRQLELGF